MKTKKIPAFWIWILFAIGCGAAFLLFWFNASRQIMSTNTLIMVVFLAVVFIMFVGAAVNIRKKRAMAAALYAAADRIRRMDPDGDAFQYVAEQCEKNPLFDQKYLDAQFTRYLKDSKKLRLETDGLTSNIENYIDYDAMLQEINVTFLNQISGTLTGLGILGTFVGLSLGLNSFDLTGGIVEESVQPLMDGIKVAFHTSILGLLYSLPYNFLYRKELRELEDACDEFISTFTARIVPNTKNGAADTFMGYEDRTVKLLERQLIYQESQLKQQKYILSSMDAMHGEMVKDISEVMSSTVVPELRGFKVEVNDYLKTTQQNQMTELSRLVDAFVMQMNASLGESFTNLKGVINDTLEWQKRNVYSTAQILEKINQTAVDLNALEEKVSAAVGDVTGFVSNVRELQESVSAQLQAVGDRTDAERRALEEQQAMLTRIQTSGEAMTAALTMFNTQTSQQTAEAIASYREQTKSVTEEVARQYEETMQKIQEKLGETENLRLATTSDLHEAAMKLSDSAAAMEKKLDESMNRTFGDFDSDLAEITEHFAKTISEMDAQLTRMQKTMDKVPKVIHETYGDMDDKFGQMQKLLDQYLEYTSRLRDEASGGRKY